jgi:hypothetical protein
MSRTSANVGFLIAQPARRLVDNTRIAARPVTIRTQGFSQIVIVGRVEQNPKDQSVGCQALRMLDLEKPQMKRDGKEKPFQPKLLMMLLNYCIDG